MPGAGGRKWGDLRCLRVCRNDRPWLCAWRLRGGVAVIEWNAAGKGVLLLLWVVFFLVRGDFSAVRVGPHSIISTRHGSPASWLVGISVLQPRSRPVKVKYFTHSHPSVRCGRDRIWPQMAWCFSLEPPLLDLKEAPSKWSAVVLT